MIPSEVFPTRYRSTGHGISAASGKLGAIISQFALNLCKAEDMYVTVVILPCGSFLITYTLQSKGVRTLRGYWNLIDASAPRDPTEIDRRQFKRGAGNIYTRYVVYYVRVWMHS